MFSTLEDLLFYQSALSGIVLLAFGVAMSRKGLFRWTSAGFWTWVAFVLYFVTNPLTSSWYDLSRYRINLIISGGLSRGEWILLVSILGICVFFLSYLIASPPGSVSWRISPNEDGGGETSNISFKLTISFFIGFAFLALLRYRTSIWGTNRILTMESGRFTGEVTGYEFVAHNFLFVPVIYLILSRSRSVQFFGWLTGGSFLIIRMMDRWDRFTVVSLMIAMVMAVVSRQRRNWPSIFPVMSIIIVGGVLLSRGHSSLNSGREFIQLVEQMHQNIGLFFASVDTSMLSTWYLKSFLADNLIGYDYGIPLINYALFGFLPGRFFPWKYFLVNWWQAGQPLLDSMTLSLLAGAKQTLLGSFYSSGGVIGVIIGAWLMGILCRKMEGLLIFDNPTLIKATGISLISILWMVWGSDASWGLTSMGVILIPSIVLWIVSPKQKRSSTQSQHGKNFVVPRKSFPINRL